MSDLAATTNLEIKHGAEVYFSFYDTFSAQGLKTNFAERKNGLKYHLKNLRDSF